MRKIKYYIGLLILTFTTYSGVAQDHHFSQFESELQYLNPALTGMSWDKDFVWRANIMHRSQWIGLTSKAFTNQLFSYDMPYSGFGLGGYITNNRAGDGNMNTMNFMLGGAYEITIDPSNVHNLFGGFQIGILHRNINVTNLIFDSQYSYATGTYDPNISSGEVLEDRSLLRFDANLGFFYTYNKSSLKYRPYGGLSLFHITMPNESFTAKKSRMPIRWVLTGGCDYKINDNLLLMPDFLFMQQSKASEFVIGSLLRYILKNTDYKIISGLAYRIKDALIVHAGLEYKQWLCKISYDINISYLSPYTHLNGAFELSAIYLFKPSAKVSTRSFNQ